MKYMIGTLAVAVLLVVMVVAVGPKATAAGKAGSTAAPLPYIQAATPQVAGQYFARIGGCNDCHTPDWAKSDGKVPVSGWLVGGTRGFTTPVGTTYASNLRLFAQEKTENQWVAMFRKPKPERPPMPWMNYKTIGDRDLRALYRFIHKLGPKGVLAPDFVPAKRAPKVPVVRRGSSGAKGPHH